MSSLGVGMVALLMSFFLNSCSMDEPEAIPAEAFVATPSGSLNAGDVIRVSYPGAPEMNLTQKVQPNGRVSLPMIGDVKASGRNVGSFQSSLESMYAEHLTDPKVLVSLETPSSSVYVSGEVREPGKISLDRPMTAIEAIMEAGGFSKYANAKRVYVIRNQNGKHQRYVLNVSDTLSGTNSSAFQLRPYDVVYVKESNW
ncbi:polysaccharide biosynthesis/export family protein [Haloferula sp.]|uniref:polysaccharide biosynthesis/export family protein n=1 Tax=Haloferula sp. TaxID=2497595 RepID=UPI00329EB7BE